jgi:inorganic pyrophosphatase
VQVQVVQKAADIQEAISEGANSFLFTEYRYLGVFMVSEASPQPAVGVDVAPGATTHGVRCPMHSQVIMAVLIFALLGSIAPENGRTRADEVRNGLFSTIAFLLGAATSILSGYVGMKIATYANARTALQARKGIAPAFMCGGLR